MNYLNNNIIIKTHKNTNNLLCLQSFRTDKDIGVYLKENVIQNKSKFIRNAIHFYIAFINNPKKFMLELKRRNPEIWKYVNRKKFM